MSRGRDGGVRVGQISGANVGGVRVRVWGVRCGWAWVCAKKGARALRYALDGAGAGLSSFAAGFFAALPSSYASGSSLKSSYFSLTW